MYCTLSHLYLDQLLWSYRFFVDTLKQNFQNISQGDIYDCGLRSVPCESDISRAVFAWGDSDRLVFWFDLFVFYIGTTLFTVLGLFGNVMNVIIFSKNKIGSDSTNAILLALSVVDLLQCVSCATMVTTIFLCFFDASLAVSAYNLINYKWVFHTLWFGMLSLDFVSLLAIQRAAVVIWPFKAPILFSYRNIKIVIALFIAIFLITIVPFYDINSPQSVYHPYFKKHVFLGYKYTEDKVDTNFMICIIFTTFRYLIDMLVMMISVLITMIKLNQQGKHRSGLKAISTDSDNKTQMSVRELKVAKMSLAICIVTIGFCMLYTVVSCLNVFNADKIFTSPFILFGINLIGLQAAAYSCFNFFLYIIMSPQYREAFYKLFRLRK